MFDLITFLPAPVKYDLTALYRPNSVYYYRVSRPKRLGKSSVVLMTRPENVVFLCLKRNLPGEHSFVWGCHRYEAHYPAISLAFATGRDFYRMFCRFYMVNGSILILLVNK